MKLRPALLLWFAVALACLPLRSALAEPDRRAPVLEAMAEVLQARYVDAAKADALAAMLQEAGYSGRLPASPIRRVSSRR
ncbi:hypothetical protein [Luteimonas vadosa]|uniref:Peptidase S41 n=1 Tax=Luteimonas vadosa TaxID=1165507 RepID=A0ABP9E4M6_9GAMM